MILYQKNLSLDVNRQAHLHWGMAPIPYPTNSPERYTPIEGHSLWL